VVRSLLICLVCLSQLPAALFAQFGPSSSQSDDTRYETGFELTVPAAATGIAVTFPIPADWSDQKVELIGKSLEPSNAKLRFIDFNGTKQARVDIARLPAGGVAKVLLTYQVDRKPVIAPQNTEILRLPSAGQLTRDQRQYLLPSPFIESTDPQITQLAESTVDESQTAWKQLEALYRLVHEHVEYENGPMRGAIAALNERRGDCEEMSALFIALCRANQVPARTVWVPGHCYPEFLLSTPQGENRWIAVEMTNNFRFGESPEKRPILQKGDKFRVRGKREPQHYLAHEVAIRNYQGATPPVVRWIPDLQKEPPVVDGS